MAPHKEKQKMKDREENQTVIFLEDVLHQVRSIVIITVYMLGLWFMIGSMCFSQ